MALGFPAILTPKGAPAGPLQQGVDLRSLQTAIDSIRERIQLAEQQVERQGGILTQIGTSAQINTLVAQVGQLAQQVAALQATLGAGDVLTLVANAAIQRFDPIVPVGPSSCLPLDPTDPEQIYSVLGLAQQSAGVGQQVLIQRRGAIAIPGALFEPGRAVFADTTGFTQAPSYVSLAIPLGVAVGISTIWISPQWPVLRAPGFDPGFEEFLAVTYGMVADAVALAASFAAQPDGLLVKIGTEFVSRTLQAGAGIGILNPDGIAGDPVIYFSGGGPVVVPPAGSATFTGFAPTVVVA